MSYTIPKHDYVAPIFGGSMAAAAGYPPATDYRCTRCGQYELSEPHAIEITEVTVEELFDCILCNKGVIETGNNDLPCACGQGDKAIFNVGGDITMTGAELRRARGSTS